MREHARSAVRPRIAFVVALASLACAALGRADGDDSRARATLDVQRLAAQDLAAEALRRAGIAAGERVWLRVDAADDRWITEQAFLRAASAAGAAIGVGDSAGQGTRVEVHAPVVRVRYGDAWQDGLFGRALTERTVAVEFSCTILPAGGGEVRLADQFTKSITDTVRVDDIASLETASVRSTQGEPPRESFLDRIAEPFLIVGATGVAVYLLFNIRTSP
jgi:hypothetical protein